MMAFQGAVDATFAAFGIDAVYTAAGGELVRCGSSPGVPTPRWLEETRIEAESAAFEVRGERGRQPRPDDQLTIGGGTFVIQGEPQRRDPDGLVWSLDVCPA